MIRKQKLEELRNYIEEFKTIQVLEQKSHPVDNLEKSFLEIEQFTCLLGNGQIIHREKILKNKKDGNATIVVPITEQGQTILVVQPRVFTESTVGMEFPAGYVELGEDPMLAGKRELEEETGYIPKEMYLLAKYYQDQGCSKAYNHSYLATGCRKETSQKLDESEFIHYFECSYQEALELADMGYINDANSLLALEKSKKILQRIK